MTIIGIDHVLLAMPPGGEDLARWFYVELLALDEAPKPGPLNSRGGCWFEGESTIIHLGVEVEFRPSTKAHLALLVRNLEALQRRLTGAGVRVVPDDTLVNVSRFYAYDPFGNRIEFIQAGDGFSDAL